MARSSQSEKKNKDEMTVQEAGRLGGERTAETHDRKFYEDIGHKGGQKGGQRVRELIEEGKEAEGSRGEGRRSDEE